MSVYPKYGGPKDGDEARLANGVRNRFYVAPRWQDACDTQQMEANEREG